MLCLRIFMNRGNLRGSTWRYNKKILFEKLDFQLNAHASFANGIKIVFAYRNKSCITDLLFPLNSFTLCSDHLYKQLKEALKEFPNFDLKLFMCLLQWYAKTQPKTLKTCFSNWIYTMPHQTKYYIKKTEETMHKPSKVTAEKNLFSSVYVICTTSFHVITGRH